MSSRPQSLPKIILLLTNACYIKVFRAIEVNVPTAYIKPNDSSLYDSDIAVVKLDRPAVIGKYVSN